MPIAMPLLKTKLSPPPARANLVARPRLIQPLNAGLTQTLTLISAPAGFGKTTLLTAWIEQSSLRVAWLSLDENDNDLATFLSYLIAAIRTRFPQACPDLAALVGLPQLPEVGVLASVLINEIDDLPDRLVLVLDDYHHITSVVIHDLLDCILRQPPLQLHVVITSRTDPPLALNRLRVNGLLTDVRARDLRFLQPEAEIFLAQTVGVTDSEQLVEALLSGTEGWIAGLQLAAISLRTASDKVSLARDLGRSSNRQIMTYLFDQVLQHQTPPVRDFLVKTSLVDRLTPALAEALLESEAAARSTIHLAELERAGLFLSALDDQGEWYSYHALFRELLRQTLRTTHAPGEIAALHRRAAMWLSQHAQIDEAVQHALVSGDTELAAQIVIDQLTERLNREEWQALDRWLALLPSQAIESQVWLLVAKAEVLQIQFRWDALLPVLKQAEQQFAAAGAARGPIDQLILRGYLDSLWASHWLISEQATQARDEALRALRHLPPDHTYAVGISLTALAVALQWLGEFASAEQVVTGMLALLPSISSDARALLRPLFVLMNLHMAEGYIAPGKQTAETLLQKSIEANAPVPQAWARLALGTVAYELNDLRGAADHFRAGVELRYAAHVRAGQECLIGLALTYQAQGRHVEAQSVVSILSDYHRELVNPQLNVEGRSLQARLAVLNGDMLTARNWSGGESSERGLVFGWCEVPSVTRLRLELADSTGGDLGRARQEVDRLLERVRRLHQPRRQTELLMLKALICDRQGERAEAVIQLKAALAIAEPRGLIRSIVDAGPQVLPLLQIIKREAATPYIEQLLAALQPPDNSPVDDTRAPNQPEVILTRREREVLTLLGQHQTDREIAAALVISTLTVRTHIEHLAEKLGVRGRRAIVTQAREMGLLT